MRECREREPRMGELARRLVDNLLDAARDARPSGP